MGNKNLESKTSCTDFFRDLADQQPQRLCEDVQDAFAYLAGQTPEGSDEIHRVHPLIIPKVYTKEDCSRFEALAAEACQLFFDVIRLYLNEEDVRAAFGFSPLEDELIRIDPGYLTPLPIARLDIFYNEETGESTFCEINTDGTSAMDENRLLYETLDHYPSYQIWEENEKKRGLRLRRFELFDSWVQEAARIYGEEFLPHHEEKIPSDLSTLKKPRVAIVDFMEKAYRADFVTFQKHFAAAGFPCSIEDIRSLRFQNNQLVTASGEVIDLVYRRAVTSDIAAHADEVGEFLDAYRAGAFCMLGSFRTQIIHNKKLFIALRNPALMRHLSAKQIEFIEKHVPYTHLLDADGILNDHLLETKDNWILKPLDSYAAHGIVLGRATSELDWARKLCKLSGTPYLYQRFQKPYQILNFDYPRWEKDRAERLDIQATAPSAEEPDLLQIIRSRKEQIQPRLLPGKYHTMTGLYLYGGKLAGLYTRVCQKELIGGQFGGRELASLVEEEK